MVRFTGHYIKFTMNNRRADTTNGNSTVTVILAGLRNEFWKLKLYRKGNLLVANRTNTMCQYK